MVLKLAATGADVQRDDPVDPYEMAAPAHKPSIDTCNACGKLFPRVSMRLCTQCSLVEENRFQLVREYLVENDGAALGEIARETGVSSSDVRRFTEGGRLIEITSGMSQCTCGGVGERCRYCRSRLSSSFRQMEATMKQEAAERGNGGTRGRGGRSSGSGSSDEHGRTSYVKRIRRLGE